MPSPADDLPKFANDASVTREQLNHLVDAIRHTSGDFAARYQTGGDTPYGTKFAIKAFPATVQSIYTPDGSDATVSAMYNCQRGITKSQLGAKSLWRVVEDKRLPLNFIATNIAELDDNGKPTSNFVAEGQQVLVFVVYNRQVNTSGVVTVGEDPGTGVATPFYLFDFTPPILSGTIETAWDGSSTTISVQPENQDLDPIDVTIPYSGTEPQYCGYVEGDTVYYVATETGYELVNNILPPLEETYQGWYFNSSEVVINDYLRAADTGTGGGGGSGGGSGSNPTFQLVESF